MRRFQVTALFALEDKRDRLVFWPSDAAKHALLHCFCPPAQLVVASSIHNDNRYMVATQHRCTCSANLSVCGQDRPGAAGSRGFGAFDSDARNERCKPCQALHEDLGRTDSEITRVALLHETTRRFDRRLLGKRRIRPGNRGMAESLVGGPQLIEFLEYLGPILAVGLGRIGTVKIGVEIEDVASERLRQFQVVALRLVQQLRVRGIR